MLTQIKLLFALKLTKNLQDVNSISQASDDLNVQRFLKIAFILNTLLALFNENVVNKMKPGRLLLYFKYR